MTKKEIYQELDEIATALACAPNVSSFMEMQAEERIKELRKMLKELPFSPLTSLN